MRTYVGVHWCVYVGVSACTRAHSCAFFGGCVDVRACVRACVCMCVCVCEYVRAYVTVHCSVYVCVRAHSRVFFFFLGGVGAGVRACVCVGGGVCSDGRQGDMGNDSLTEHFIGLENCK